MKGLIEIKRLTVINIVDNETDALSSPCCCMKPTPNTPSSTPDDRPCTYTQELNTVIKDEGALDFNYQCHAAHGLSLLLIADYDEIDDNGEVQTKSSQLLFDGGPDPAIWKSNAKKLKIDLPSIGRAVLSHFHVDHSNGLKGAVEDISEARTKIGLDPLIVDIHKSKIVRRGLKLRGKIYPMIPDNPTCEEIESLGGKVEVNGKAHVVGDGCFYISGEIPRNTPFETGIPGHFNGLPDGNWVPDEKLMDERYVAVKIRGRGIVVFSACSHAGIINVCNDVVSKLNASLTGVVGGFHLAGSSVENRIEATIEGLRELKPDILLAGHCTGWRAKAKLYEAFEYNFQPLTVGGKYVFNSM